MTKCIRECLQEQVGRTARSKDFQVTAERRDDLTKLKEEMRESARRVARTAPAERLLAREQHKKVKKRARRLMRKWKAELVQATVKDLEWATQNNDTGLFYRVLRDLGVWLHPGAALGDHEAFMPEQGAARLRKIGGEPNQVNWDEVASLLPEQREVDEALDEPPSDDEIHKAMYTMRESAAGDDEVTANTLKVMAKNSPRFRSELYKHVRHLWKTDPDEWEDVIQRGVVFLLWKQNRQTRIWTTIAVFAC